MSVYREFLKSKELGTPACGLPAVTDLAPHLYAFQQHCVDFNLRIGRGGLFLDTGMGKTECQLEWCQKALEATGGSALVLTPLAVAAQTKRRADRWGYGDVRVVRQQWDIKPGISICNYERIHKLDLDKFDIVSLDEASILKSFLGKTTRSLIQAFNHARFRLVATATPAPNDHTELAGYADFLDILSPLEMLARFFINDTSQASQEWRLKGHAVDAFWDWMASWSRMATKPSDLGDPDDARFALEPYRIFRHRAKDSRIDREFSDLFGGVVLSATNLHDIKRQTSQARAELAGEIVSREPNESWLIWCDTDYEADALRKCIPGAFEIRGSMSIDEKESRALRFDELGEHLITKPSCCGYGLDWSHCARMLFVGRSFSYETWYQAVRRCWRYGQRREVHVHLIVAEGESEIGRVIDAKSVKQEEMKLAMRSAMHRAAGVMANRRIAYDPRHETELPEWL